MPDALISINNGKNNKDYIEIMGKSMDLKRSNVKLESTGRPCCSHELSGSIKGE